MSFNQTHDTRHPLTITLAYCGCPEGDYRANIPRYGITTNHDEPTAAVFEALVQTLELLNAAEELDIKLTDLSEAVYGDS